MAKISAFNSKFLKTLVTTKSVPLFELDLPFWFLLGNKTQRIKLSYHNLQEFNDFQEQNKSDKFTYFTYYLQQFLFLD